MKKIILPLILLALLVQGCASVSVTNEGKDVVVVQNTGCFLFCAIPLFSGDPEYPNEQVCNWFSNTVKVETNIHLLDVTAAEQGARGVRNVITHPDEEKILWFILKRKILQTSAELIKD